MKKVLVTGADGFIFSNYCNYNQNNYELILLDKHFIKNDTNQKKYICDLTDLEKLKNIFKNEKPDIIIHGAAESAVDKSINNPSIFINSNILGTQNLINVSVKYNVEKFIYISTDEVMGHVENMNDDGFDEIKELNPRNPYSASKASGELFIKCAANTYGLKYLITRCSNNYGPRQTKNKLIPKTINSILNKESIIVYGEGKQIRDWTHVKDNCDAINLLIENNFENDIFNIAANQEYTNIEIVNMICNYIGGKELITFIKDPRPGHDFRYAINSNKIRNFGWNPKIKIKNDLFKECIDWYLNNFDYLKFNE